MGRRDAVLDGKVSDGHVGVGHVAGRGRLSGWGPPQRGVEAAVIDGFEEQAQEVGEEQRGEQSRRVGLSLDRVPGTPPAHQQDSSVGSDEGVVDEAPASGPTFCHVEPAEVPDDAYGSPVEPLAAEAVHEPGPLQPGPRHKDQPQQQEVDGHVAPYGGGEEGQSCDTRRDQQKVPQEVNERRAPGLLGLVREKGAQGAVIVHHHPGDGGGGCSNAHNCKQRRKT